MFGINKDLLLARKTGEYKGRMYSRARAEELYRKDNPKTKKGPLGIFGKFFGNRLKKQTAPAPQALSPTTPKFVKPDERGRFKPYGYSHNSNRGANLMDKPYLPSPVKQQETVKTIYKNPANITTEYSPFGKPLAAIAPVVLPENYQEPKKASISTSGIAAIGAALLAGLL